MQPHHPPPLPTPRRWPVGLLVGFLTGIVGAILAVPISDWAMKAHHVSAMEGGRACAAVGIWAPLAFLTGMATGFGLSFLIQGDGLSGYLKRQGLAFVAIVALVCGGGALGWGTADHPPLLEGKNLALDLEVRVPAKGRSVEDLQKAEFEVALVVSASDRNYSDLRWSDALRTDDFITVRAWAPLNSRNAGREITAGIEGENRQIFNVMLTASPKKIDEAWSDWMPPRQRFDGSKPAPDDAYAVRYRVRFAEEYSPTPTPEPIQEGSPVPEEAATSSPNETL